MLLPVSIRATGVYYPREIQHSNDIDKLLGWPEGKSERQSGIVSRRKVSPDETASMMATEAVIATGFNLSQLDRLIVTSIMPEQPIPTTAALMIKRLGLKKAITAYDINASCIGFLQAIESAATAITLGLSNCSVIAAVELSTLGLNEQDHTTISLFGDGSAAAVLVPAEGDAGILAICLETYPEGSELCEIRAGGSRWNMRNPPPSSRDYLFHMEGTELARLAMDKLPHFINKALKKAGVQLSDIDCIIPHQASRLGLKFLKKWVGSDGPHVIDIIADHGNQVSVSLPTALHIAITTGHLHRGDLGMMVGTAAGFGMGIMIFRY